MVRRGEWNEYSLIHSIANGAPAFLRVGGKLLYAHLARLAFLRWRWKVAICTRRAYGFVAFEVRSCLLHASRFIPKLGIQLTVAPI